jgi:hypothetical protein
MKTGELDWADLAALLVLARVIADQDEFDCEAPVEAALCGLELFEEDRLFVARCAEALRDAHLNGFRSGVETGRLAERTRCHDICICLSHRWFGADDGGYEFGTAARWCAEEIAK